MGTIAVAGATYTFEICLYSQADTKLLQNTPTIAAGDFVESSNGAAWNNLDNLPTVEPALGEKVQIILSAAETANAGAGGRIVVKWEDVADAEWCSGYALIYVHAGESVFQTGDAYAESVLVHAHAATIEAAAVTAAAYAVMTSGVAFRGTIASIPGANQFIVTTFIGFGAGAFMDATAPYQVFVFRDNGGLGGAPQGETQTVTAYNSATGQIDHTPFSTPLVAGDQVILMHPMLGALASIKADTAAILDDTGTSGVVLTNTGLATSAAQEVAAAVWVNTVRTLTTPAATPAQVAVTDLPDIVIGLTYAHTLTGLTIPVTWEHAYLTLKDLPEHETDAAAIVQVKESNPHVGTDGEIYIFGAAGVAANAGLVVNQAAGTVAITISAISTIKVLRAGEYSWDLKCVLADASTQRLAYGTIGVTHAVTRATT